ncbi:MAG: fibronectin type III domain-containing protein [Bacteroidales bacterium]
MKKLLLFITTMLLWSFSLYSVDVQIGSGTTTTSYFPIYSCYNYSYSQQIYLAGEISDAGGGIGPITKVRFFYSSGGTSYSTWSDWTIYLGNTSKSVFTSTTDWIPLAALTQVFSGDIPTPVAGNWIEITLPTPFNYTGGNLVVAVDENSASYSCTAAWRSYNAGTNRGIMYYDDNTNPNPASPPIAKTGPTATIAQVQFDMAAYVPTTPPNCAVLIAPVDNTTVYTNQLLIWQSGGGTPTSYDVYFGTSNPPAFIQNQPGTSYTPALAAGQTYYWQIVPRNSIGAAVGCPVWSFRTPTVTQLAESFESTTFPPLGWTNPGSFSRSTTYFQHGVASAYKFTSTTENLLTTPLLTITPTSKLEFYARTATANTSQRIQIKYSTDRITWNNIGNVIELASNAPFAYYSVDLGSLAGAKSNYYLAFSVYYVGSSGSIYIDQVFGPEITPIIPDPVTLSAPADGAVDIQPTVQLSWTPAATGGIPQGYKIYLATTVTPTFEWADVTASPYTVSPELDFSTTYYWRIGAYNGAGETLSEVRSFTVMQNPTISTFPHVQSFDNATFPPLGWTNIKTGGGGTGTWDRQTSGTYPTCYPYSGAGMARYNNYGYTSGTKGELISPPINFPDNNYRVSFWMYRDTGYPSNADLVNIYYNTSATSVGGTLLGTINRSTTLAPVVPSAGWYNYVFNIPQNKEKTNSYIIFEGVSGYGNNVFIDHIVFEEIPSCAAPTDLIVTDITQNSAKINWTPGGDEEMWNLLYGEAGFDPETEGTLVEDIDTNPFLLEGLDPNTNYDVYVQAVCGEDDISEWSAKKNFKTLCTPISTFPWTESFEGVVIPAFPDCWFKENGDWVTTNNANSTYDADARTGTQFLRESYSATNEFMWTPGFQLYSGISYDFSFWWAGDTYSGWTGDVFVNTSQISTGATQIGTSFVTSGTTTTKTYAQFLHSFIPNQDGIYYFAIRINATGIPWYLSFDDFRFEPTPSCIAPKNLVVSNITATSAKISWTPGGDEEMWNLLYGEAGFDPETEGTLVENITTNSYTITGLSSSTQYQVYVQANCNGDNSPWAGPVSFVTECAAFPLPFAEDFTGVTIGTLPDCWSVMGLGQNSWSVQNSINAGGPAPEMRLYWSPSFTGTTRLVTPGLATGGASDFKISFDHLLAYYAAYTGAYIAVEYSVDLGQTWNIIYKNFFTGDVGPQPENLTFTLPVGTVDFKLAFTFYGYSFNIDGWFIDNVLVESFVPGSLAGNVSGARGPVEGAKMTLLSESIYQIAFTDENGDYEITGIPAGFYDITCEAETFLTKLEEDFEIVGGITNTLNFVLDYAEISVSPESFEVEFNKPGQKIEELTISNPGGTGPLTWNAVITGYLDEERGSLNKHFEFSRNIVEKSVEDASLSGSYNHGNRSAKVFTTCPEGSIFSQLPDTISWKLVTSEEAPGYFAMQYFSGANAPITGLTFWGGNLIYTGAWSACSNEDPMPFVIQFYTDNDGFPGDFVASFNPTINRVNTGIALGSYGNLYMYHLEIDKPLYLSSGWVAIQGQTSDPDCWFMWAGSLDQGTPYLQFDEENFTVTVGAYALSMCLVGGDSWLTLGSYTGVVPPAASSDIDVIFNSNLVDEGTHNCNILLTHDGRVISKQPVNIPVTMTLAPLCPKPVDLTATLVNPTAFNLGWTPVGDASVFNVIIADDDEFEIGGAIDPYDSFEGIEDNPLFIEDLQPETDYWFYVQADCGEAEFDTPKVNRFWLQIKSNGDIDSANSGGTANEPGEDGTWGTYNDTIRSIWFYNSPLDSWNMNKIKMGFYVQKIVGLAPAYISYCVSYTTPEWDPQTPGFPTPNDEEFIRRSPLNGSYTVTASGQNKQWFELEFDIPDYNPEWISVGISGINIKIANTSNTPKPVSNIGLDEYWDVNATGWGIIVHESIPKTRSVWAGPKKFTTLPLCPTPTNLTVSDITATSAEFDWVPGFGETTWNLKYYKVGVGDTVFANNITKPYPVTGLTSNTNYAFMVQADCGGGDVSTWSVTKAFKTPCGTEDIPYVQNFDGVTAPAIPDCMTVTNDNGDIRLWVTSTSYPKSTPNCMYILYNTSLAMDDWFFTPGLNLIGGKTYIVEFYYRGSSTTWPEKLEVKWGTAPNAAGMTGGQIWNNANITNTVYALATAAFTPVETGVYYVGWHGYSNADMNYLCVDDILIDFAPTCPAPTALTVSDITATSAVLGWTPGGNETKWNIKYGEPGFNPETGGTLISGITTNPFLLEGLNSSTAYAFSVQADCGEGDVSAWSVKMTFATLCEAISIFPWTESFENVTIPAFPNCWFKESGSWVTTNNASSTYDADARTGTQFLRAPWGSTNSYIWTPGFAVQAGKTYEFSFWWAGDNYAGWTGDVFVNTSQISTGATQVGTSFVTSGTTTTKTYAQFLHTFVPDADGIYYFAIRINSTSTPWYISFDDFEFKAIQTGPPENPTYSGVLEDDCYDGLGMLTIDNAQVEEGTNTEFRAEVSIVATDFEIEEGAVAYLYAGQNIVLGVGVHVAQGANFLATIMDEITYCEQAATMVTAKSEEIAPAVITPAEMDAMFTVYPNPTTGRFTLLMKEADEASVINVEIFGLMGERVLQTQVFGQNQYEFDLSGSPKGVYIIRILSGKQTSIEKLIKQ